jgi:plastocyanin
MKYESRQRLLKLGTVVVLGVGVFAAGLLNRPSRTLAQDVAHNTYMVEAGGFGEANVEVLAFSPSYLQVHRGDTVMWHVTSLHNMRFGDEEQPFITVEDIDGKPTTIGNPKVFFPTQESGSAYMGGDANSGLPPEGAFKSNYTLVMDLEPGTYTYRCDVHPGMTGIIEVVADDEAIPSPTEVDASAAKEMADQINSAIGGYFAAAATAPTQAVDGVLTITVGTSGTGRASSLNFNAPLAFIKAGEKVQWVVPADSPTLHFVNSAPFDGKANADIIPKDNPNGPPTLLAGPGFVGTTADGATVAAGESFNSAPLVPGMSYTLTFKDPGVYAYICHVHPGMNGTVIVQ